MARILLLGTWLTNVDQARSSIERRSGGRVSFSGLQSQLEVTGPRIEVERGIIVNERSWKHGMPRSVVEGQVERQTDELFVVVDEPPAEGEQRRRRG